MNQIKKGYKQTKVGVIPEDWEVTKVGEKFNFLKTYSNSREDLNNIDEISYIHYGEIHTKHKFYIDFDKFELPKINKSKLPNEIILAQNGDLVIADASEDYTDIGKSAEIKNLTSKAVSGLHTFLLRDKNNNFANGYKGYLFYNETVAKSIKKIATGISVLGISKTNLSNLEIPLPPIKEQEKIADILITWDEAITKQEKLIKAKELQKKALMQKLLSGEVRFNGFADEWEDVRLGDVCDIKKGEQLNKDTLDSNGDFPVINGGIEPSGYTEEWNTESNTITISEGGNSCGYVNFLQDRFWSGGHCYTLLNLKIDKIYLYQFLKYNQHNIMKLRVGSGLPNIQKSAIERFLINKPVIKEQQKIAEVLSLSDKEIDLLKKELEELKLQKKALMQKLLTGEVRIKK